MIDDIDKNGFESYEALLEKRSSKAKDGEQA
jgi:hypothetical protein